MEILRVENQHSPRLVPKHLGQVKVLDFLSSKFIIIKRHLASKNTCKCNLFTYVTQRSLELVIKCKCIRWIERNQQVTRFPISQSLTFYYSFLQDVIIYFHQTYQQWKVPVHSRRQLLVLLHMVQILALPVQLGMHWELIKIYSTLILRFQE